MHVWMPQYVTQCVLPAGSSSPARSASLHHLSLSPVGGVITPSASSCMVRSSRSRACSGPSLYSQLARMKPRAARPLIRISMRCGQPGHEKSAKWSSRRSAPCAPVRVWHVSKQQLVLAGGHRGDAHCKCCQDQTLRQRWSDHITLHSQSVLLHLERDFAAALQRPEHMHRAPLLHSPQQLQKAADIVIRPYNPFSATAVVKAATLPAVGISLVALVTWRVRRSRAGRCNNGETPQPTCHRFHDMRFERSAYGASIIAGNGVQRCIRPLTAGDLHHPLHHVLLLLIDDVVSPA